MALAFLRPDADDVDGRWVDSAGGTTLFDKIDEVWAIGGSSIDLGFADGIYFDGSGYASDPTAFLSCSRASTGYAKNRDGTLTSFATNTLRIGNGTGLLVEDVRTNLMLRSQDFSTGWTLNNLTQTSGFTAPDGTSTATNLVPSTSNVTHTFTPNPIDISRTANQPFTMSFYAKANGYDHVIVDFFDPTGSSQEAIIDYDLGVGSVNVVSNSPAWTNFSVSMEAMANGWYRCIATGTSTGNDFRPEWRIKQSGSYVGDGTSGVLFWGMQAEDNAAFPSSYIPTTSAAATRAADSVTYAGALNTLLSSLPYSILMDVMTFQTSPVQLWLSRDDSFGTPIHMYVNSNDSIVSSEASGHVLDKNISPGKFSNGVKVGVAMAAGARSLTGNGLTVATDAFASAGSSGGMKMGTSPWFGYFRRATFWNSKLADATLQSLTDPNTSSPSYETDYDISSPVTAGDTDTMRVRLSDPSGTPQAPGVVRFNCKKNNGGDDMTLAAVLMEGSTEIARWEEPDITTVPQTFTETLTTPQFNAISNFNNLYLKFISAYQWWLDNASIDLDFANNRLYVPGQIGAALAFTDYLSISRASSGYAKTKAGTITSFSSNVLRITDLGLLVEDARTNTNTKSQVFTGWDVVTNITAADNQIAAPDGTTTAGKLTDDATNARHGQSQGTGGGSTQVWTFSAYFKDGTRRYATISAVDGGSGNSYCGVAVDLQTGTITATDGSAYISSTIESLANGWYRVSVTGTLGGSSYITVGASNSGTPTWLNGIATYAGNSSFFYVWGAQAELGSFASSYIPTAGASATRAADLISFIGAAKTLLEANSDQSIVADVANNNPVLVSNNNQNIICDDGSSNDSKLMFGTSGAAKNVSFIFHSVASGSIAIGSGDFYSPFKCGFSQNAGSGISIVGNGGTVGTNANRMALTNPRLGAKTDSDGFYGYVRRLTLWNTKLADATLQSLTT